MLARKIECDLQMQKLSDTRRILTSEVHPLLRKQPGFVDVIEALDPETGHFVCMTFWKSRDELNRYDREVFPQIAEKLTALVSSEPTVLTFQVENSSVHNIAAGRAAA